MSTLNQNAIKHKLGLLNLAQELGNVSKACQLMGFSRDTFYRYQNAKSVGGVEALFDENRRKPNVKNRVEEVIIGKFREVPVAESIRCERTNSRRCFPSDRGSLDKRADITGVKKELYRIRN